jgi:uncharacterized protein (TIGR00251 family)
MTIIVFAKPRSAQQKVEKNTDGSYTVRVCEPPDDGKANKAIIRALTEHFHKAQSCIEIVSGHAGKKKIIKML